MVDIKQLELLYFQNDEPVQYKLRNEFIEEECVLEFKPILVKDWTIFESCMQILLYDQQDYKSLEIISMSYLEFIVKYLFEQDKEDQITQVRLLKLLEMSCGIDALEIRTGEIRGKTCLILCKTINGVETSYGIITSTEFDDIKSIILHQNKYDYDDRYVDPDIKRLYEIYNKSKNKGVENPTLEKQKVFLISKTGMSMKDVNNMTYRTFSQVYMTNVRVDIYFANHILKASEKYKVDDVIYPLFEKEKDKYAELFVDANKLSSLGIDGAEQLQNIND